MESVDRAKCKIKAKKENVVGVQLPVFETFVDGGDSEWLISCHAPDMGQTVHHFSAYVASCWVPLFVHCIIIIIIIIFSYLNWVSH